MVAGPRSFVLAATTDVEALGVEVCDAMRRGSGIVSFEVASGETITGVFSPGVMVTFEDASLPGAAPLEPDSGSSHWDHEGL